MRTKHSPGADPVLACIPCLLSTWQPPWLWNCPAEAVLHQVDPAGLQPRLLCEGLHQVSQQVSPAPLYHPPPLLWSGEKPQASKHPSDLT